MTAHRVTVGLTDNVARILDRLTEQGLTKTDLVNRAVQLYAFLEDEQALFGKQVLLRDPESGELERVKWL